MQRTAKSITPFACAKAAPLFAAADGRRYVPQERLKYAKAFTRIKSMFDIHKLLS